MKYGNVTLGQVEAVWNKLGGADGVEKFLRGELVVGEPVRRWTKCNRVIYFSVTSGGVTGEEWISRLEGKGFRLSDYAKQVLRSSEFKPTKGVTTEIAVLKGLLFSDSDRVTSKIRDYAETRNLTKPNAEVACMIRENFSDKEIEAMGLVWVITMHEPIEDSDGNPSLLGAPRYDDGSWLSADWDGPGSRWPREHGFAFAVSQV